MRKGKKTRNAIKESRSDLEHSVSLVLSDPCDPGIGNTAEGARIPDRSTSLNTTACFCKSECTLKVATKAKEEEKPGTSLSLRSLFFHVNITRALIHPMTQRSALPKIQCILAQ